MAVGIVLRSASSGMLRGKGGGKPLLPLDHRDEDKVVFACLCRISLPLTLM